MTIDLETLARLDADKNDALRTRIAELEAERDQLRKTNTALNRRCQSAESGLRQKIEDAGVRTFGRALANSAAGMYRAEAERMREALTRIRSESEDNLIAAIADEALEPKTLVCSAALTPAAERDGSGE